MGNIIFSENSRLNDTLYGRVQAPVKAFLTKRGEQFEAAEVLKMIFNVETSTHFGEMIGGMTAMDNFIDVGENGEYPVTGYQEGYKKLLENHTWKNSFSISKEMIDDGKIIDMKARPEAFLSTYYRTRELLAASLFGGAILGQTEAAFGGRKYDITTADNVTLFNTTHPSILGGASQTNKFADAFSATALAYGESRMQGFKDENGNILDIAPDTIIIANDPALKKTVFEAIGADKDPTTANNGFNFTYGRWNVIVWNYLNQYITEGTAPWLLMDSEANKKYYGAVWLDREPLTVRSDIDEDNDANIWRGRSRFIGGFVDWRPFAAFGITGGTQMISA